MAKVRIEKFIDGAHETSFNVPTFVFVIAKKLLPQSALSALARQGIHVQEILNGNTRGTPYVATLNIHEHGISKQISVSLN